MSNFVNGFGNRIKGYPHINLDHVARLTKGESDSYDCWTADGKKLGTISSYELDGASTPPITPDMTATILVVFALEGDELTVTRYPVIGWRHNGDGESATPVTVTGYEFNNGVWCLELRTGLWAFPEDRDFDSLEKASAHARQLIVQKTEREEKRSARGAK